MPVMWVILWHCRCRESIKDSFVGSGILQAAPEEAHTLSGTGRGEGLQSVSINHDLARQPGHQHWVSYLKCVRKAFPGF